MSSESPSSPPTARRRHHQPVREQPQAKSAKDTDSNNNGKQLSPVAKNLVEISVDTSSNIVDTKQLDSGSNQSGSDSGLGCTNSASSDNSTFNAIGREQTNINNSPETSKNNNRTTSINLAASKSISYKHDDAAASSKSDLSSLETRTGPDGMTKSKQTSAPSLISKDIQTISNAKKSASDEENACSGVGSNGDDGQAGADGSCIIQNELVQPPYVRVMKSLLKKSSSNQRPPVKHNRFVTFNQTVIVFCEEIDTSSSTEQFDPPLGYHDPVTAFEPPEDYCDIKVDHQVDEIDGKSVETDGLNLTDGQLIGLLNNESLLETFKLNCEDLSEDDFPITHLNSGNSYLCNDAISDYDSDSESSLYADQKDSVKNVTNLVNNHDNNKIGTNFSSSNTQKCEEKVESLVDKNVVEERKTVSELIECHNRRSINCVKPTVPQKPSMPARMKVSTVDNNHRKQQQQAVRKESDLMMKAKNELSFSCKKTNEVAANLKPEPNQRGAMLIKQGTVEPINLSKPVHVASCPTGSDSLTHNHGINTNETSSTSAVNEHRDALPASKPTDQIRDNTSNNQILREVVPLFQQPANNQHQVQQQNQPSGLETSQLRAGLENVACHLCRIIESSSNNRLLDVKAMNSRKEQAMIAPRSHTHSQPTVQLVATRSVAPQVTSASQNQPIVFNQSCISCREACIKQQNVVQPSTQIASSAPANVAQQPIRQPVAYQFVYVVDQRGNRIRALSVVRPPTHHNAMSAGQALVGRQIFLTQNGIRYPNPVSIIAGQQASTTSSTSLTQALFVNQRSLGENAQHPKLAQYHPNSTQPIHVIRGQPVNVQSIGPAQCNPTFQELPQEGHGLRQHTVYCVRQPLGAQTVCHSIDPTAPNQRSFPDPHEVRRLDGLRGPTSLHEPKTTEIQLQSKTMMTTSAQPGSASLPRRPSNLKQADENDDPTFGFSKRPAVKVVATNTVQTVNQLSFRNVENLVATGKEPYFTNTQVNNISTNNVDQFRPASFVTGGSQTLDRRTLNQQHMQLMMKENISNTSSMSNIHGAYLQHMNKINSNNSSQQQRISNSQITDSSSTEQKESSNKPGMLQYSSSQAGENAFLMNSRIVMTPSLNQQVAGFNGDKETSPNQKQMKKTTQEQQLEVAYSMNV